MSVMVQVLLRTSFSAVLNSVCISVYPTTGYATNSFTHNCHAYQGIRWTSSAVHASPEATHEVVEPQPGPEADVTQTGYDGLPLENYDFPVNSMSNCLFDCFQQNVTEYLPGLVPRVLRQDYSVFIEFKPHYNMIRQSFYEYLLRWYRTADFRDKRSLMQVLDTQANLRNFTDHDVCRETSARVAVAMMSIMQDRIDRMELDWDDYVRQLPYREVLLPRFMVRVLVYFELCRYKYILPYDKGRVGINYSFIFEAKGRKSYRKPMHLENSTEYLARVMSVVSSGYSYVNIRALKLDLADNATGFLNAAIHKESRKSTYPSRLGGIRTPDVVDIFMATPTGQIARFDERVEEHDSAFPKMLPDTVGAVGAQDKVYTTHEEVLNELSGFGEKDLRFWVGKDTVADDILFAYLMGITVDIRSSVGMRLRASDSIEYSSRDVEWIFHQWFSKVLHDSPLNTSDVSLRVRSGGVTGRAEGLSMTTGPSEANTRTKRPFNSANFRMAKEGRGRFGQNLSKSSKPKGDLEPDTTPTPPNGAVDDKPLVKTKASKASSKASKQAPKKKGSNSKAKK